MWDSPRDGTEYGLWGVALNSDVEVLMERIVTGVVEP
jgi:hypothetical protein